MKGKLCLLFFWCALLLFPTWVSAANHAKLRVQGFTVTYGSAVQLSFDMSLVDADNSGLMWSTSHPNAFKTPDGPKKFDWTTAVSTSLDGGTNATHHFKVSAYSIPFDLFPSGPPGLGEAWTLCGEKEFPLPYSTDVKKVTFNPKERITVDEKSWVIFLFDFLEPPSNPGGCGGDGCVEFGDGFIEFTQNPQQDAKDFKRNSPKAKTTLQAEGQAPNLIPGKEHIFVWKVPTPNGNPAVDPGKPKYLSTTKKAVYEWTIDLRAEIKTDKPQTPVPTLTPTPAPTPVPPEDIYVFTFETFVAGGANPPADNSPKWARVNKPKDYTHFARNGVAQLIRYRDSDEIDPAVIDTSAAKKVWIKHIVTLKATKELTTRSAELVWKE